MVLSENKNYPKDPILTNLNPENYAVPSKFNEVRCEISCPTILLLILHISPQKVILLGKPHVDSFDHFINIGLEECVRNLSPIEFVLPNDDRVSISIGHCSLGSPQVPVTVVGAASRNIYPLECRQRKFSYRGKLVMQVKWSVNGIPCPPIEKEMGDMPIMLKVSARNIHPIHTVP